MTEKCFRRKIIRGFVCPGVAVWCLLIVLLFVQPWIPTTILTHPVGGPPGMVIGLAFLPFVLMFAAYMLVAISYMVILPVKYYRGCDSFEKSVLRFLNLSDVFFLILDIMLLLAYIEVIRWDYITMLNLPFVLPLTALAVFVTVFFFYWTRVVYEHEGIRLLRWKTVATLSLNLIVLLVISALLLGSLILYYELPR